MGKPDAPEPPDPRETSAAQTGTSVGTSIANAFLGNVNRVGPQGTTTFDQTSDYTWTDPYTNQSYTVPRFTETVTLSPGQQETYDLQQDAEKNLAGLAQQQSGFLQDYLAQPVDLSNEATEARLYELGSARLDPRFERQQEQTRSNLISRGIREGSDAWTAAMGGFEESRNDAYNQLLLGGRGQAVSEALAQRNQPINEITALLSGSQVETPQFSGGNMPTIPTTDNAGLINQNFNQQMGIWQQENAQRQGLLGGLFGLGAAGIAYSDDDVKKDKTRLGDIDGEMGIWSYHYKGEPSDAPMRLGLMASEVEKEVPEAVARDEDGIRMVDYGRALGLGDF